MFSVAPAVSVIPLPDDLDFEEAATLPLALLTAAIGVFIQLGLKQLPDNPPDKHSIGGQI